MNPLLFNIIRGSLPFVLSVMTLNQASDLVDSKITTLVKSQVRNSLILGIASRLIHIPFLIVGNTIGGVLRAVTGKNDPSGNFLFTISRGADKKLNFVYSADFLELIIRSFMKLIITCVAMYLLYMAYSWAIALLHRLVLAESLKLDESRTLKRLIDKEKSESNINSDFRET